MNAPFRRVHPALAFAATHPDGDVALTVLSARVGLSSFHLHRMFTAVAGETPKQYTLRLRVSQGAALLLTSDQSVLDVALSCGFQSHEAFTRAFARRFGMSPRAYRARGFAGQVAEPAAALHAALVKQVGPCVGLFHVSPDGRPERIDMTYDIVKKDLVQQPVLVARRRVKRSEIAAAITDVLTQIFQYAQERGIALAGHPFTRYVDVGAGLLTIEPGMRVVTSPLSPAAIDNVPPPTTSRGPEVVEDVLPGGTAATTVHAGPYETLSDAYGALEAWMEAHQLASAGAPWESYITDPTEHPDPKDWKTEVCWPAR